MEKLPEIKIGDNTGFQFGELVYRATVYKGKVTGLKIEQQIVSDTSRSNILKDLMEIAAATVEGKEVAVHIRSDEQGPYRITRTETEKTRKGNRGDSAK